MKKNWIYWWSMMLLLTGAALVTGCDDDDDDPKVVPPENALAVTQKSWKFSGIADQYAVAVFANVKWKVTADADWVTLDKKEGNGNDVFTVSVPANTTGASRTATLTVKGVEDEKLVATFGITQEAGVLNIDSEPSVDVPADGATVVIDVESDMDYTFEMGDWVAVVAAPVAEATAFCAITKSKITLNIAPNHSTEARACDVVIKVGNEVKKTIRIEQAGAAEKPAPEETLVIDLEGVNNDTLQVLSTGGFLKIKTKGNIGYNCELSAWTKWADDEGQLSAADTELENMMSIRVMPNLETDREATLTFTWTKDGKEEKRGITIRQKAIELSFIPVGKFPINGGTINAVLAADRGEGSAQTILKVELSGDGLVFEQKGPADVPFGTYSVLRSTPNYLTSVRELQVVGKFQYRDYEPVVKLFKFEQEACPSIKAADADGETNFDFTDVNAGSKDFTVTLPFEGAKWDARIYTLVNGKETECTWASLTKKENGFTVTWLENTANHGNSATVKVFLKEAETLNYAYLNFSQPKAAEPVELKVSDPTANAVDVIGEVFVYYSPKDYYCKVEVIDNGDFLTLSNESDWKLSDGVLIVPCTLVANDGETDRVAKVNVSLYDKKENGTLIESKQINYTQKGKPVVREGIKAEITTGDQLKEDGMGGPVVVEVTGIVDPGNVKFVWFYDGGEKNASWLVSQYRGKGLWWLYYLRNRGPSGSMTLYVIPEDESFKIENEAAYGKVTVIVP